MTSVNRTQFKADFQNLNQQAQADGLNLQAVRQQAISGLPQGASQQDQQAAVSQAIQQAIQQKNDPTLTQDFNQVQNDKQQMKANGMGMHRHGHHGGPKGAGAPDQTVDISSIDPNDPAAINAAISSLSGSSDPNSASTMASLQSMLLSAQSQNPAMPGANLNFTA